MKCRNPVLAQDDLAPIIPAQLAPSVRIQYLHGLELNLPPYDGPVLEAVADHLDMLIGGKKPRGIMVVGLPGTGKTTMISKVIRFATEHLGEMMHKHAILSIRLTAKSSITSFAEEILEQLGDPLSGRQNQGSAERRVTNALRRKRTFIVIVDEAHHLLYGKGDKSVRLLTEALKNVGDVGEIILILVGVPELVELDANNRQHDRRSLVCINLPPFNWTVGEDKENFLIMLHEVDKGLGFPKLADLDLPDMAFRIYQALSGVPGATIEFIVFAAQRAIKMGSDVLTREHLRLQYEKTLGTKRPGYINPFDAAIPDNWAPVDPGFWFRPQGEPARRRKR
jgi:type II secretory pathway predicted ATPase ExeA